MYVRVDGAIQRGGDRVMCAECGADRGWTLHCEQRPWTSGEVAWAECPAGHPQDHPLVYPEMVHALRAWHDAPEADRPEVGLVLEMIAWRSHRPQWTDPDVADELSTVTYWPAAAPAATSPPHGDVDEALEVARWRDAVRRAEQLLAADPEYIHTPDRPSWDERAIGGLIAIVLYALARRQDVLVHQGRAGRGRWPPGRRGFDPRAGRRCPGCPAHRPQRRGGHMGLADPALAPTTQLATGMRPWDGLPRGIGRGTTAPAVSVCALWAHGIVQRAAG